MVMLQGDLLFDIVVRSSDGERVGGDNQNNLSFGARGGFSSHLIMNKHESFHSFK